MQKGDFVIFVNANSEAAEFCQKYGLTGKIKDMAAGMIVVDAALGYDIFAQKDEIAIVAKASDIPTESD